MRKRKDLNLQLAVRREGQKDLKESTSWSLGEAGHGGGGDASPRFVLCTQGARSYGARPHGNSGCDRSRRGKKWAGTALNARGLSLRDTRFGAPTATSNLRGVVGGARTATAPAPESHAAVPCARTVPPRRPSSTSRRRPAESPWSLNGRSSCRRDAATVKGRRGFRCRGEVDPWTMAGYGHEARV